MPDPIRLNDSADKTCDGAVDVKRVPRNAELEAVFLGGCLIENKIAAAQAGRLLPEHFYEPLHGRLWSVMLKFVANGKLFTPVTLKPMFEDDHAIVALGGMGYLIKMTADGAGLIGADDFATQIIELARRRNVLGAMVEGIDRISNTEYGDEYVETDDLVAEIDAKLWDMADDERKRPVTAVSAVARVRARQEEINSRGFLEGAECVTVPDLHKIIGPLTGGNVTIIGARTSVGKTALALSIALGLAMNSVPNDYLHNEMTPEDISMRYVTDLSFAMGERISLQDVRLGKLNDVGLRWLDKVEERAAALPLRFHDIADKDIDYIRSLIQRSAAQHAAAGRRLQVVTLDYVQKVEARDGKGKEIEHSIPRLKKIMKVLMKVAKDLDLHIIALAQLGRQVDDRPDHKPRLNDLKESGDLEQDADNVILLWRPEIHLAENEPEKQTVPGNKANAYEEWYIEYQTWLGKMELIGAKVRHGPKKSRRVRFYGENSAVRGSAFQEAMGGDLFSDMDDDPSLNFG